MTVCRYKNHCCLVTNFKYFANSYKCPKCRRSFSKSYNCIRHVKTCDLVTKQIIKSGVYSPTPTVFEELERFGISVPQEERFYPFRIVWDCEVYFKQLAVTNPESKLQWTAAHELLSIAATSNIPNYSEAKCWISNGDSQDLVNKFVGELDTQADVAYSLLVKRYDYVISALNELFIKNSGNFRLSF